MFNKATNYMLQGGNSRHCVNVGNAGCLLMKWESEINTASSGFLLRTIDLACRPRPFLDIFKVPKVSN